MGCGKRAGGRGQRRLPTTAEGSAAGMQREEQLPVSAEALKKAHPAKVVISGEGKQARGGACCVAGSLAAVSAISTSAARQDEGLQLTSAASRGAGAAALLALPQDGRQAALLSCQPRLQLLLGHGPERGASTACIPAGGSRREASRHRASSAHASSSSSCRPATSQIHQRSLSDAQHRVVVGRQVGKAAAALPGERLPQVVQRPRAGACPHQLRVGRGVGRQDGVQLSCAASEHAGAGTHAGSEHG